MKWRYASAVVAKPFGTRTPEARRPQYLTERRILTADDGHIAETDLSEPANEGRGCHRHLWLLSAEKVAIVERISQF
jgi:hypothetical protein